MEMFERDRDNAWRLAGVLYRYAEDPIAIKRIAAVLNYLPQQLQEDMGAVYRYMKELEASGDPMKDNE